MQEDLKNQPWVLIADGEFPSCAQLKKLTHHKCVMVLDGAYSYVRKAGIKIHVLLGDFDTISSEDLKAAKEEGVFVQHAPDQMQTDLQKGLVFLDSYKATRIDICAATGKRLQHTLYNLRMLKKFHRLDRPLTLLTGHEVVFYREDTHFIFKGKVNDGLAILGFPYAEVTSKGLKYDMVNLNLHFESFISISNNLMQEDVSLNIKGGALLIHEVL